MTTALVFGIKLLIQIPVVSVSQISRPTFTEPDKRQHLIINLSRGTGNRRVCMFSHRQPLWFSAVDTGYPRQMLFVV
jgi:hypothetical protein